MTEIILKSTIDVVFVDKMGSDRRIVEAMLVSTKGLDAKEASQGSIEGRINFLIEKRHGTPFECGAMTICVHAPIKVWREWHRHRIGQSYSEESGRYRQLEPVFWIPPMDRPMIRPDFFKSSQPDFFIANCDQYAEIVAELAETCRTAYASYERMLEIGADRGLARDVLGVGIFSACYVTFNPRSIMAFLELRTREDTAKRPSRPLWEIDNAARQVEKLFAEHWPITHAAWVKHGRMAP